MRDIVYLGCPYTDTSIEVRVSRFEASARAAAELIHRGMFVYSPITMTHPIDLIMNVEGDTMGSDYWCDFDEAFMSVCSEMIILTIPGWRKSRGIRREAEFFERNGKSIRYMQETADGYVLAADPQDHDYANHS